MTVKFIKSNSNLTKTSFDGLPHFYLHGYHDRNPNEPRKQGGSCPLAYALKCLDGLNLSPLNRACFWNHVLNFVSDFELNKFDVVVFCPMNKLVSEPLKTLGIFPDAISPFVKVAEIKSLPISARKDICPLVMADNFSELLGDLSDKRVLMVDDLIASGTTMRTAIKHIKAKEVAVFSIFNRLS